MGQLEEGQLETAALGSENGDKMEKGYRNFIEGHVKMGLWHLLFRQLGAIEHFCCEEWNWRTLAKLRE